MAESRPPKRKRDLSETVDKSPVNAKTPAALRVLDIVFSTATLVYANMVAFVNMTFVSHLYRATYNCSCSTEELVTAYGLPYRTFENGNEVFKKLPDTTRFVVLVEMGVLVRFGPFATMLAHRAEQLWQVAATAVRFRSTPENLLFPLVPLSPENTFRCVYFAELSEFEFSFHDGQGLMLNEVGSAAGDKGFSSKVDSLNTDYKGVISGAIHPRWGLDLSKFTATDAKSIEHIAHRLARIAGVNCSRVVNNDLWPGLTQNLPVHDMLMQQMLVVAFQSFLADRNPKKAPSTSSPELISFEQEDLFAEEDKAIAMECGEAIRRHLVQHLVHVQYEDEEIVPTVKATRHSHGMEVKQRVVNWMMEGKTAKEAVGHFKTFNLVLDPKAVARWFKQRADILQQDSSKKRLSGAGRHPILMDMEIGLAQEIIEKSQTGQEIKRSWIKEQALERSNDPNFKASDSWLKRFMKRHKLE